MQTWFKFLFGSLIATTALAAANAGETSNMSPLEFVKQYEAALGTQKWEKVSPLIHENASVVFSNGSIHKGKVAVRAAYERNFEAIENENYQIANVHWLFESSESAVYMFDFFWTGIISGQAASGAGRGTAVLVFDDDRWQLLAEHLGPFPQDRK